MVWVAVSLAAGLYVAAMGFCPGFAAPLALMAAAVLIPLWPRPMRYRDHAVAGLLFFAAGALVWNLRHAGPPGDPLSRYNLAHPGTDFVLEGWVRDSTLFLPDAAFHSFTLEVDRAGVGGHSLAMTGGVKVHCSDPVFAVHSGERLRVKGRLEAALGTVNHGVRGMEDHYRARGVYTRLRAEHSAVERCGRRVWWPRYWASRLRTWEADALRKAVPPSALPFVLAVWLGDRGQIARSEVQRFVQSGTAHILAVSGVHTGIIYLSVSALLRIFLRRRKLRTLLTMAAVLLFALAAGARISSVRAAVMVMLYLTADLFDREPDAPTALSISGILFLLVNPDNLFDTAFLLSFTCVASILLYSERIAALLQWMMWPLRESVGATLAVQVLSLPLAVLFFHVLPVAGPAANLLVIPLLTATLWLSFLTTLCAAVYPPAALLFGHAIQPVVFLIHNVARAVATTPGSHFVLVSPAPAALVAYWAGAGALFGALALGRRRRYWAGAAGLLFGAAFGLWRPWPNPATVDFLDVGRGDAAFVRTPGGTTLLIDGGDRSGSWDMGEQVVVPALYAQGVDRLDYVVATHADRDHMGGLFHVVRQLRVGTVLLGPRAAEKTLEKDFLALCKARGVPVARLARGNRLALEGATLEVLHPPMDWRNKDGNEGSLVLRVRWPGVSVLFAGDIGAEGEFLVSGQACSAALLKVPHHGSASSNTARFLDAVSPSQAVISTAATDQWDAVGRGVMQRYACRGIRVWRTDYHGGIRLRRLDGQWVLWGARPARGYSLAPPQEPVSVQVGQ